MKFHYSKGFFLIIKKKMNKNSESKNLNVNSKISTGWGRRNGCFSNLFDLQDKTFLNT